MVWLSSSSSDHVAGACRIASGLVDAAGRPGREHVEQDLAGRQVLAGEPEFEPLRQDRAGDRHAQGRPADLQSSPGSQPVHPHHQATMATTPTPSTKSRHNPLLPLAAMRPRPPTNPNNAVTNPPIKLTNTTPPSRPAGSMLSLRTRESLSNRTSNSSEPAATSASPTRLTATTTSLNCPTAVQFTAVSICDHPGPRVTGTRWTPAVPLISTVTAICAT